MRWIDKHISTGSVQNLSDEVIATLRTLHPPAQQASEEFLFQGPFPEIHPVIFDKITADEIRKAALRTSGAAGLSGGDADL